MKLKIKEYREKKGLTQQELANEVVCSRQFINMLENSAEINVSSKLLLAIANALDVKVDDLIFLEEQSNELDEVA